MHQAKTMSQIESKSTKQGKPQQITKEEYKALRQRLDKLTGCINARLISLCDDDQALAEYGKKIPKGKKAAARKYLKNYRDLKSGKYKA